MLPEDTQSILVQSRDGESSAARACSDDDDTTLDRRSLRVLIVDDDGQTADTLQKLVNSWGHVAHSACDARAGLALAAVHSFDVVVFGIGLPDMDGYHLAKELRRDERLKDSFLVAMSNGYRPRVRTREANIDQFLARPIDPAALETVLLLEAERLDQMEHTHHAS